MRPVRTDYRPLITSRIGEKAFEKKMSDSEDRDKRSHYFDDPAKVKKFIRFLIGCCVFLFLLDGIFYLEHKHLSFHGEDEFPAEGWFGFYGVYGFVACVLLVLVAKQLRKVLMRGEDYYDR